METNCSSGGDVGGDEGEIKELDHNNCSTLNEATTELQSETTTHISTIEDKGLCVVLEEKEETGARGDMEEKEETGPKGDMEEKEETGARGDLEEKEETGARGDLEETPCVCAGCCSSLEKIPVTKEDDTVFHWFVKWFRFDPWTGKERQNYYKHQGGWDGQGGESLRFCKACKGEIMGLMYFYSKIKRRKPYMAQFRKEKYKLKVKMRECEPEFEAQQIYKRDNRYFMLRVKFCKLTSCGFVEKIWRKKKEGGLETKVETEGQEEQKEEVTPTVRSSRRVKRPVTKFVSPVVKKKIRYYSMGTEETEETNCNVEVVEENAVESEVQVKLEEFPEENEEDMELDNCWFNEDFENGDVVKTERAVNIIMPNPLKDPPESQKPKTRNKCSKNRGSRRVRGPKSRWTTKTKVKPIIFSERATAMYANIDHRNGNCLFCYKATSPEDIKLKSALTNDLVEANLNTIFLLRKMLHIPKSKLTSYLANFGNPQNWIHFCRQCLSVVDEALMIQKKIEVLENKLRKLQNGMVEKINSTFKEAPKKKRPGSGSSISRITEETRQFIYSKSIAPPIQLIPPEAPPPEPVALTPLASPSPSPPPPSPSPVPSLQLETILEEDPMDIFEDSCDANDNDDDSNDQDYNINENESPLSPASSCSPPPSPLPSSSLSKTRKRRRRVPRQVTKSKVDNSEKKEISDDPLDQGSYKCHLCPTLKAMSLGKFYIHGIFHYNRQFKCSECDLHWSGPDELDKNPFNSSKNFGTRNNHVCSEASLEKMPEFKLGDIWKCAWCPETFHLDSDRDSHEVDCLSRKDEADKLIELEYKCLSCPEDKKGYRSHEEWLLHRVLEHPRVCVTSCHYCDETFEIKTFEGIDVLDTYSQKAHISSTHATHATTYWEACDFCGLICERDRAKVGYHMVQSHGLTWKDCRSCPICYFRCSRNRSLRRHLRINHSLINFSSRENLRRAAKIAKLLPTLKASQARLRRAKDKIASIQKPEEREKGLILLEGRYLCSLCPSLKKPMSLVQFYGHVIFHYKRPFKCSECNLFWSSHAELEKNPFTEKCGTGEHLCSSQLLVQMDKYEPGNIWKCGGCKETFSKEPERDLHEKEECPKKLKINVELKYKCLPCSQDKMKNGYRSYEEWLLHRVLEHTEMAITSCLFCDESCAIKTKEGIDHFDTAGMRVHVASEHPSCRRTVVCPTDICDFCGISFIHTSDLRRHFEKGHGLNERMAVYCRICCYRTNNFTYLKKHVMKKHAVYKKKVESEICDVCGMKLYKIGPIALADHKLAKHGIEPPEGIEFQKKMKTCEVEGCGFRSLLVTTFKLHMMKIHGAERSHKCNICGKGFMGSGKLAEHLRIHKNKETKPYQCEICGNSFALRNYLYIHMRLSHLNRPFASTHKKKPSRRLRKVERRAEGPAQASHHLQPAPPQFPSQPSHAPVPCSSTGNVLMDYGV